MVGYTEGIAKARTQARAPSLFFQLIKTRIRATVPRGISGLVRTGIRIARYGTNQCSIFVRASDVFLLTSTIWLDNPHKEPYVITLCTINHHAIGRTEANPRIKPSRNRVRIDFRFSINITISAVT